MHFFNFSFATSLKLEFLHCFLFSPKFQLQKIQISYGFRNWAIFVILHRFLAFSLPRQVWRLEVEKINTNEKYLKSLIKSEKFHNLAKKDTLVSLCWS